MAKITVTIPDASVAAIEAAARAAGKSVSAWVAEAADAAAVRAAGIRFRAALAAHRAAAADHDDAVRFALASGRRTMQAAVAQFEEPRA